MCAQSLYEVYQAGEDGSCTVLEGGECVACGTMFYRCDVLRGGAFACNAFLDDACTTPEDFDDDEEERIPCDALEPCAFGVRPIVSLVFEVRTSRDDMAATMDYADDNTIVALTSSTAVAVGDVSQLVFSAGSTELQFKALNRDFNGTGTYYTTFGVSSLGQWYTQGDLSFFGELLNIQEFSAPTVETPAMTLRVYSSASMHSTVGVNSTLDPLPMMTSYNQFWMSPDRIGELELDTSNARFTDMSFDMGNPERPVLNFHVDAPYFSGSDWLQCEQKSFDDDDWHQLSDYTFCDLADLY